MSLRAAGGLGSGVPAAVAMDLLALTFHKPYVTGGARKRGASRYRRNLDHLSQCVA